MPFVDDKPINEIFDPIIPEPVEPKPAPSLLDVPGAAMRLENDIYAGVELMSTPKPKVDLGFNLVEEAKKREVDPRNFLDAVNADHLDSLIAKKKQEEDDNEILDQSGWVGFLARMASGVVSPTTLIPMIGAGGTGLRVAATVGLNAAAGAAMQEAVLFANQRTRTKTDAMYSIGGSMILGSVLGGIAHTLSKSVVDKMAYDMANPPRGMTISPPTPGVGDAGAKEATHLNDAGKLRRGWGADALAFLSPVTRGFQQWNAPAFIKDTGGSAQVRKMTAGFSQASLALDENKKFLAASPGGNVEDLKRTYAAISYAGSKILEDNYVAYILGTQPGGIFKKQRAVLSGATRPDGKLTYAEFKRQIALDMWSNFSREGVPDMVRKAAKEIDEKVYKKLYDEGVEVGIFTGKEKTVGDENYANRVYNNEVIMRRHNEFVKILADHYREGLNKDFNEKLLKLNEAMRKDKQLFEDMNLPFEKAQKLREDLLAEGVDLTDVTNPAVIKGVEQLKANTKAVKELTTELDNLKKIKLEGTDLEGFKARQDRMAEIEASLKAKALESEGVRKALGTELEKYELAAKEIRRRLNNLTKNIGAADVRRQKKLDKIVRNEDAQVTTILRAQKQLQKFIKMLESATDDKLDAELNKLRGQFMEAGQKFDKLEEDYTKLADDFNKGENDPFVPPEGDGSDGNNPPPGGPNVTPPGKEPPLAEPKLSEEQLTRVKDIVDSNIEGALDQHKDMEGIDNALREYEKNIYDTIKDEFKAGTPERELAIKHAEDLFREKIAKLNDKLEKIRGEEDWVKPIKELENMSKRDMDDAGLLPDQIAEVLASPVKFRDMMRLVSHGYKLMEGIFRQVTAADLEKVTKEYNDFNYYDEFDTIFKAWEGKTPDTKLPDKNGNLRDRKQAIAELDAKQDMLKLNFHRMDRAHDKAMRYPDEKVMPPIVVPPERPAVTGDPLTNKLHPDLELASEYWRTVKDATTWLERYGTPYERVLAKRMQGEIGNAAYYTVDVQSTNIKDSELKARLGSAAGHFARNVYFPGQKVGAFGDPRKLQAYLLMRKGTNRQTLMHEILHAATAQRIDLGKHFPDKYPELAKLYNELEALRLHAKAFINKDIAGGNSPGHYVEYSLTNVHELVANVLSTNYVRDYYKNIPPRGKGKDLYTQFVTIIRRLLGIPDGEHNAFTQVLETTDRLMKEKRGYFPADSGQYPRIDDHRFGLYNNSIMNPDEIPGKAAAAELSANFKNWFGDSKVVNEDGSPKVVYHGTDKTFTEFKKNKVGKNTGTNKGFFFSDNSSQATSYAFWNTSFPDKDGNFTPLSLKDRVKNKLGVGETAPQIMPVYLNIRRPYETVSRGLDGKSIAELKAAGFDGARIRTSDGDSMWVAFEPTQIKSASGNRGTFNPSRPSITESVDGGDPALKIEGKKERLATKMDEISKRIETLSAFDRSKWRAEIEDMMRELADTHAKINAKRVTRNEKLWQQIEKLSPEAQAKKIDALKLKMKERPQKFIDRWNTKNAGNLKFNAEGLLEGDPDFTAHAMEMATQTVDKIKGTDRRLAYSDLIKEKRGAELARVLNIPSEKIQDFLETDIEKMLAIYTRTLGSDISIARVFGSPDAAEDFAKLTDEQNNALAQIETLKDKDGNPLSKEAKEKLQYETNKFYTDARKDLMVLLERAKSMRGIPRDAASWSARGAKMAMDINFMRMMGNVVVSSVADPARIVMKYGLTRAFRDAFIPMITNWKTIRMSQHEAKLAGSGLDPVLHSRAYSLFDIFDDAHKGTAVEKATHWASTKMGLIALFDHWTAGIKQVTAGAANAKLLDNIAAIMEGTVTGKRLEKAQEFLAKNNLDADLVERIWKEVTSGEGGGKVNGIWLPNTDEWTDAGARRAYRAALGGEIDSTIITPGFERPSWVDSSIPARMVAQFKSFGFSSTQKTLMAGLQEHDAAFFNGVMSSLALGALSYYLYGVAAGGDTYEEMMNAGPDKWADEAISRAGITGIFDEVQRVATRVPLLQQYASFSGTRTTRRGGGGLVNEALGPSFDLLQKAMKIGSEIDDPTQSTLHTARLMLPLQNIFYLRQLFDKIEAAAGSGLPETRRAN